MKVLCLVLGAISLSVFSVNKWVSEKGFQRSFKTFTTITTAVKNDWQRDKKVVYSNYQNSPRQS